MTGEFEDQTSILPCLTVGALTPSEIDTAVALWESAGLTRPWSDPRADIELAQHSPSSTVLAGRVGGELVATVMVGCDGHRGWTYYLATGPTHRGNGYGRVMMNAAEIWLTELGAPRLNLMVHTGNADVIAYYEALGYARNDVVVLQKMLDPSAQAERKQAVLIAKAMK